MQKLARRRGGRETLITDYDDGYEDNVVEAPPQRMDED